MGRSTRGGNAHITSLKRDGEYIDEVSLAATPF